MNTTHCTYASNASDPMVKLHPRAISWPVWRSFTERPMNLIMISEIGVADVRTD